ncbi:Probable beta-ketoadipyl-CoA thiolase [Mycobacteroides abscessus subsp. bolletii]|uniref:thiolase family protein n=1 Tax=Mycobacteroides abscessus TaxID=36809 RepID=UPI0009A8218B|nr:thiolase family protein [Mycobacteroides abscessus]SKG75418.1 Probable beta-ketoadipyl-CoA thiolase [Mycobacteroides abscessus subsp. bolletii]SKH25868.1 Probable beta-ketoadipyl-CoA thiolase [Mycobacteroides abscessus subsp. bolletii]
MKSAYLYASARTPFGRYNGALADIRPDDLAAANLTSLLAAASHLNPALIDEVILGNANGAGEDNRNVARMSTLLANIPVTVPATTVNRLCGSSLDATVSAARAIESGDCTIVVAGGVESMTRAPWVLPKPNKAYPAAHATLVSTTLGWRLVNPGMPSEWTASLGECNEELRERLNISRQRQDEFASRSHYLADAAWREGFYDDLVSPVPGTHLGIDESIRSDTTPSGLAALRPAFRSVGTITAGNASPLSDGAAALLLGSEEAAIDIGIDPVVRIAGKAATALEPNRFGFAPVEAALRALDRAGVNWSDVGAVELNEAFAVQALACIDAWRIDPDIVNVRGGAIAIGHPLGASGARLVGTLAKTLRERRERWGVAAICIGVGQAIAIVLENCSGVFL